MTRLFRAVPLIAGLAVVVWLCARFGFKDLAAAFQRVNVTDLLLYACSAVAVLLGYSVRWLLVARALGLPVPLKRLVAARLSGDAVGTLLPGGKVGGDPLRAALIYADGLSGVRASAGVALDRVMELIGNSVVGIVYVSVFSMTRAVATRAPLLLAATLLVPLLALLGTMAMLWVGMRPVTPVFGAVARLLPPLRGGADAVRRTEDQLTSFLRDRPLAVVLGLLASLLVEAMIIVEYHYLLAAFGLLLDLPTLFIVLLASGLARVVPTPAGLGALEVSQVTALGLASGQPQVGFIVAIVLRLHETLWTLVGLLVLSMQGMSFARLRVLAARKGAA